jgi:ribosome-associated protein
VATKVELYFNLNHSNQFSEKERKRLIAFLANRLNSEGVLILSCSDTRSQWRNKKLVTQRFFELLEEGLKKQKERIETKVPKTAQKKRLKNKRIHSEKKANRKPPEV